VGPRRGRRRGAEQEGKFRKGASRCSKSTRRSRMPARGPGTPQATEARRRSKGAFPRRNPRRGYVGPSPADRSRAREVRPPRGRRRELLRAAGAALAGRKGTEFVSGARQRRGRRRRGPAPIRRPRRRACGSGADREEVRRLLKSSSRNKSGLRSPTSPRPPKRGALAASGQRGFEGSRGRSAASPPGRVDFIRPRATSPSPTGTPPASRANAGGASSRRRRARGRA